MTGTRVSRWLASASALGIGVTIVGASLSGQVPPAFAGMLDEHPSIQYAVRPTTDRVVKLNDAMSRGERSLQRDDRTGYLTSLLDSLGVSVESQLLVFSKTGIQRRYTGPQNPRALYFDESVVVGYIPGAPAIEVAAHDPQQGVVFYTLDQKPATKPQFARSRRCLECHLNSSTGSVPGMVAMSMLPLSDDINEYARGWSVDHRTPVEDRWGGWFVTGARVPRAHLGNVPVYHVERSYTRLAVAPTLSSVSARFDASDYLSPYSDVVALLVQNHQVHMTNLLTRLGWEARIAANQGAPAPARMRDTARELVDYLLFVDEAPLRGAVIGASGFAEQFAAAGPRDKTGRSLRQFDLERRLFRYPCSYLIYAPAFDALPPAAQDAVYERMWEVLSGQEKDPTYDRLSAADRRAIIEILRDTKAGLPTYFAPPAQ